MKHHRVLCVDDEPAVLRSLNRLLRREPYELITVDDPRQALRIIDEGPVSLVITDQRMPGMSGTELLADIRRRSPETTRVMLTAYPDSATPDFDRLIAKPWNDDALKRAIRSLLGPLEREVLELLAPLDAEGRKPDQLIAQILPILANPEARTAGVMALTKNLARLEGSVVGFLKQLLAAALESHVPIGVLDGSGLAAAFLDVLGKPLPLTAPTPAPPMRILLAGPEAARDILEAAGHTVEVAGSADEAIRRLQSESFHRLALDLDMRETFEAAQHVAERDLRIPMVALMSRPRRWSDETFLRLRIGARLLKPYSVRSMLDAL